jgi:hypothetical protein
MPIPPRIRYGISSFDLREFVFMCWRILILAIPLSLSGCYTYSPLDVHIYDANTNEPVKGLQVQTIYPHMFEFAPNPDFVLTDAQGNARVKICTNYHDRTASLWLPDEHYLLDEPTPAWVLFLPADNVREIKAQGDAGGQLRIQIGVLRLEDYRIKYH